MGPNNQSKKHQRKILYCFQSTYRIFVPSCVLHVVWNNPPALGRYNFVYTNMYEKKGEDCESEGYMLTSSIISFVSWHCIDNVEKVVFLIENIHCSQSALHSNFKVIRKKTFKCINLSAAPVLHIIKIITCYGSIVLEFKLPGKDCVAGWGPAEKNNTSRWTDQAFIWFPDILSGVRECIGSFKSLSVKT